jgi:predicted dehydrogenase
MGKIKLGIIGIGNMGSGHIGNLLACQCPEIELCAVSDINPARLEWAGKTLGANVARFETSAAMLDSGLIDACLISVPHYHHAALAIECMRRGVHVMVEKPAGVYTLQVREMNEEADRHPDVVFGMMFNQRTDPLYRKMREYVHSGRYGKIRRAIWIITNWYRPQAYYDSGNWRATWSGEGGGVLLNQCPHQLDLWQWILGMPDSVEAHMSFGKWHDIEVEDDVTAYLSYAEGAIGVFITTTGDAYGTNRFEIQMDRTKIVAENGTLTITEFDVSEPEWSRSNTQPFGKMEAKTFIVELDGSNPQHSGVLNAWADAILHGGKLVADGREGIRGLMLSNAMHLSAFTGKAVSLPFNEQLFKDELMKRVAISGRKENVNEMVADISSTYGAS